MVSSHRSCVESLSIKGEKGGQEGRGSYFTNFCFFKVIDRLTMSKKRKKES
jgi:hypothetical protein